MTNQRAALLLLTLFCDSGLYAEDWPQFRGSHGAAVSDSQPPAEWGDEKNIVWKTELPGRGASSPIVFGDRIFLTAFSGFAMDDDEPGDRENLRLHVLAFDRGTGKLIWDQSIRASENEQEYTKRVKEHGYTSSTLVTDGEMLYAYFGVSGVVAYDWEGNLKWQANVGTKTVGFGSAASPVLFDKLLIVNASIESSTVFAFDKTTGEEVWKISNVMKTWTMPCIAKTADGNTELVINQKDIVCGYDPATGEELWTCQGVDDYIVPVPISHDGILYLLGGRKNRAMAIRLGGRGDVTESHKLWEKNIGANVTSPLYYDGHLYWSSDKGIANCMSAETGESIYRERMPTQARVYASMVRGGDRLYATTRDKGVLVLPARPEFEELAVNSLTTGEEMFNATPAIVDGKLLLRTDSWLFCIGEKE